MSAYNVYPVRLIVTVWLGVAPFTVVGVLTGSQMLAVLAWVGWSLAIGLLWPVWERR